MNKELTCFKAYDVRGKVGFDLDENISYAIGRAFASQLDAKTVVVGRDIRNTSESLSRSLISGLLEQGVEVLDIGLSGTEEVYWGTTQFNACGGIQITASHNPIEYNGMKMVKRNSQPLNPVTDLLEIKKKVEKNSFKKRRAGILRDISNEARFAYIRKIVSFFDVKNLRPLKILVNCGNGAAGPTFDALVDEILKKTSKISFKRINHSPDGNFPNGIPNPLIEENRFSTSSEVISSRCDLGIAFDGDFDRCFFFDEQGKFISGEYIVGLLASYFLKKEPKAKIVHDPRVILNIQETISSSGGITIQSKTGHSYVKEAMRSANAIYGGELSAHHYFRDFAYCDSGMIPWLIMVDIICKKNLPLSQLISDRARSFPSSGELNFKIVKPKDAINSLMEIYYPIAKSVDKSDGVSFAFEKWRFNVRISNTENVIRLNVESLGDHLLVAKKVSEIKNILREFS